MKKKNKLIPLVLIIVVFFSIATYFYFRENKITIEEQINDLNISSYLSTKGYIKINLDIGSNFMLFKDQKNKCLAVVMPISDVQANAIKQGIDEKIDVRPTTQDIIKDVFDYYNITILLIKIDEYRNDLYYAKMIIKQDNKILNMDIRPSDASAVASRYKEDIYFKKDIFDKKAQNIC